MTGPITPNDEDWEDAPEDDQESYPDDDDLYMDECGMGHDGQCSMAGSEWCDWSCPVQAQHARARIAAMKRKAER